jgi:hypothetical protein
MASQRPAKASPGESRAAGSSPAPSAAVDRFLGCSMVITRDPKAKKVTQRREIEVEAEIRGFKRAQALMRQILDETPDSTQQETN